MSPITGDLEFKAFGFPRVSGDEPAEIADVARASEFSPRERG